MDAPSPQRERLAFLDLARGIAALAVVLAHGLGAWVPGYLDRAQQTIELGRAGVILFLIISGFIIPASLEQGGSLGKFWLRRFFRLFPAYWLVIAVAYLYLLAGGANLPVPLEDTTTWLVNMTMCQGFLGHDDVNGVFWSLTLELLIYFACSLLFAVGLLRRVGWSVGMVFVLGFLPVGLIRPLFMSNPYIINGYRLLFLLPLVGLIAQRYHSGRIGWRSFYTFALGLPLVVSIVWGINKALYPHRVELVSLTSWLYTWGPSYLLFLFLLEARRLPMPAFGLWLGRISFSLYLFHPLVLSSLLMIGGPVWVLLPALIVGSLLVSALIYYGVEEPGIALGRAIERRLFQRKQSALIEQTAAKAVGLIPDRSALDSIKSLPILTAGHNRILTREILCHAEASQRGDAQGRRTDTDRAGTEGRRQGT
jgi:peptidoglycan/LPS O-acetylase OafA/YrhL